MDFIRSNFLKYKFTLLLMISFLWIFKNYLTIIEGDPAIYLSYSKNFFVQPFSFGSINNVTFGATSPLFLTLLSIFHEIFGIEYFLLPFKIFYAGLFVTSIYIISRILNTNTQINSLEAVSIFFLLNFYIVVNGVVLFESFLILFYCSCLLYFLIKQKIKIFLLLAGLAYLIRPELALINVFSLYFLYKDQKNIFFFSIPLLIPALYHLYIFYYTGDVLPSSVVSRSSRFSDVSIIYSYYTILKNDPYIIFQSLIILFSFYFSIIQKKSLNRISSLMGVIGIIILISTKTFSIRYFESFAIISIPATLCMLQSNFFSKYYNLLFIICSLIVFYKINNPVYSENSNLKNRLSENFTSKINQIIDPDEKLLIYEIQTQYYLLSKAVSMDARVGKEAIGLINGEEDLYDLMKRESIKYVSIDQNMSSLLRKDPYIKLLSENNNLNVGDTIKVNSANFVKVFEKSDSDETYKMYGNIFMVL